MKYLLSFVKKIVLSAFMLYGYNMLVSPLNIIIPINYITVLSISILGIPALISFSLILLFVY